MIVSCDTRRMLESKADALPEAMNGAVRIALLESEIAELRRRDAERTAELAARERRIRLLDRAAAPPSPKPSRENPNRHTGD